MADAKSESVASTGQHLGLDGYRHCVTSQFDCFSATHARATSIEQDNTAVACTRTQIRRLMAGRLEPGWRFSTLYLVKDSLAVMLRSAGLLQDALREFYELEAVYLNAIAGGGGAAGGHDFGAPDMEHSRALATMSVTTLRPSNRCLWQGSSGRARLGRCPRGRTSAPVGWF